MNDGYLDAECVIKFFFMAGFLKESDWKHNTNELYYPARFYHAEKNAIITLEVSVFQKRHCVTKSSIRILSSRYDLDCGDVFSKCVIETNGIL
jgi:hypothetical protein